MSSDNKKSEKYVWGPEDKTNFPKEIIVGEVLYQKIKEAPPNKINTINSSTGVSITYGEVYEISVKLALTLQKDGLKKNDIVAIVSENIVNYWIPVLGSIYLGAAVHLLNPEYTTGEMLRALNQSKPKIILCSENVKQKICEISEQTPFVEKIISFGETTPIRDAKTNKEYLVATDLEVDSFRPTKVKTDDVVFILCSSGTTGFPKGVMLTHKSPRHFLSYMCNPLFGAVSTDATTIIVPPFYHMIGCLQHLQSLYFQAFNVILTKFKPDIFLKSIEEYKVSRMLLVPPLMIFLSNHPLVDKYDLSSVTEIAWGGAPMDSSIVDKIKKRLNIKFIRQAYGSTEMGTICTYQLDINKIGSCGCLSFDFVAKVCDVETGAILGTGEVGELRFKGSCFMKGYIDNPEETANSFDEEGFLKTGDVGYYDEDEYFYIVDRLKELIKYKAFQVPPAELESVLLTHPAVAEAAVVPKPDERSGEVPVAFIVKHKGKEVTEQELIDLVAEQLSVQKRLYGGVVFVDDIPKTLSGKIARKYLREAAKKL